jgi:hypothetical protein
VPDKTIKQKNNGLENRISPLVPEMQFYSFHINTYDKPMNNENKNEFELWLKDQPKKIQKLARKYPPGRYKVKDGCPYLISRPGTVVEISGYRDDGDLIIIVRSADKLPEAIEHEKKVGADYEMTETQISDIHKNDYEGNIEPEYLEPIKDVN